MKIKDWYIKGYQDHFALGAFNVDNLETAKGVFAAAKNLGAPVIIEVSPGEEKHLGLGNFFDIVVNYKEVEGQEIFLNLDHADDLDVIRTAVDLGFDMVHFDGSKLPVEENIKLTKEVVAMGHDKGILVEGELDPIGKQVTHPEKAEEFVAATGVDIFAVSIGNKHGVGDDERLDLGRLQQIRDILPDTFFSLHGGSGVTPEDVAASIKLGVVKINVNTELRVAFRENLENMLKGNPEELQWYKLVTPAIGAVQEIVEEKIKLFGTIQGVV